MESLYLLNREFLIISKVSLLLQFGHIYQFMFASLATGTLNGGENTTLKYLNP